MVKNYRKRPVVVEAIQWTGSNVEQLAQFMELNPLVVNDRITIHTLEGDIFAKPTDFIIKGVKGEFYPCDAEVFEKTYESVHHE